MTLLTKVREDVDLDTVKDHLDRKPIADTLAQLISTLTQPFVISVGAPWGMGKTTFCGLLKQSLKERGCECVYINAWKTDYVEEPLTAFMGELLEFTNYGANGEEETEQQKRIAKAIDKLKNLGKNLIPVAVKWGTKGLYTHFSELFEENGSEQNCAPDDNGTDSIGDEIGKIAEKLVEDEIKNYQSGKKELDEFLVELNQFAKLVREESEGKGPLTIIVDELDRCRPDYGVKLLERIKHFFEVDNIAFVISADYDELAHSVKALYGAGIDGAGYLDRFFDYQFVLPYPDIFQYIELLFNAFSIPEIVSKWNEEICNRFNKKCKPVIVMLAAYYGASLRKQNRCMTLINLALRTSKVRVHPDVCAIVAALIIFDSDLCRKLFSFEPGLLKNLENDLVRRTVNSFELKDERYIKHSTFVVAVAHKIIKHSDELTHFIDSERTNVGHIQEVKLKAYTINVLQHLEYLSNFSRQMFVETYEDLSELETLLR